MSWLDYGTLYTPRNMVKSIWVDVKENLGNILFFIGEDIICQLNWKLGIQSKRIRKFGEKLMSIDFEWSEYRRDKFNEALEFWHDLQCDSCKRKASAITKHYRWTEEKGLEEIGETSVQIM